jgi:hypothetical protein
MYGLSSLPILTSINPYTQALYPTQTSKYPLAYTGSLPYPGLSSYVFRLSTLPMHIYSHVLQRVSFLSRHISRLSTIPRLVLALLYLTHTYLPTCTGSLSYSHLQVRFPTQTYLPRYTGSLPYSDISTHIYSIFFLPRLIYPRVHAFHSTQTYLSTCTVSLLYPDIST